MTDDDLRRAASAFLEFPYVQQLFDEIETAATNQCILADLNDDETRRNAAAEVRAIRRVRDRLISMSKHPDAPRRAPA